MEYRPIDIYVINKIVSNKLYRQAVRTDMALRCGSNLHKYRDTTNFNFTNMIRKYHSYSNFHIFSFRSNLFYDKKYIDLFVYYVNIIIKKYNLNIESFDIMDSFTKSIELVIFVRKNMNEPKIKVD